MALPDNFQNEVRLQQRLAAGEGNAAVFQVISVFENIADDISSVFFQSVTLLSGFTMNFPGIGIMTVLTAQGTALQK
ncbi:hypothetical protein SDC9_186963 [bioreactor metagenome]|uniref:Uncharacterized protein n=1 Tax=bioreactor metagenome TaxID=1076179 RepID=A0A645HK95_9ZZZZ